MEILTKRAAADKALRDKAFDIAKDPKYDGYQRGLASMVYKFFDKMTKDSGVTTLGNKSAIKSIPENEQLAEELDKPIIRKSKKKKKSTFKDNIWAANLADLNIVNAFQKTLNDSKRTSNKIWVDEGGEFYKNSLEKWLQDNDIVMYSTHNEGKSFAAKRFIRTIKNKIYKYMTCISMCILIY